MGSNGLRLIVLIMTWSCRHPLYPSVSSAKQTALISNPSEIGSLQCDPGQTPEYWTVAKLAQYPSPQFVNYPAPSFGGSTYILVPPNTNRNLRLDICMSSGTPPQAVLKRMIWLEGFGSLYSLGIPSTARVLGLDAAILNNDYGSFELKVPYESFSFGDGGFPATGGVLAKGWQLPNIQLVTVVGYEDNENGTPIPTTSQLLTGVLEKRDPLASTIGTCVGVGSEAHAQFVLGTAKFKIVFCGTGGTAGTNGYTIVKVEITDTNELISEPDRGKLVTLLSLQLDDMYSVSHHNLCDWFRFKTSHAVYSGRNMPIGVPSGGNECGVSDLPSAGKYRVKYGTASAETHPLGFSHYLFSNTVPE